MAKKHGPNKENLEATRRMFLEIARKEFCANGYYNASTASIVDESKMARGSLYYHFGDKKGLFRAVYEEVMAEMQIDIRAAKESAGNAWDGLINGGLKLLDLCTEHKTRRIIIDVHTALTYQERIEILQRTLLADLIASLHEVMEAGYFKGHEASSLGIVVFGILSEGSRSFELADDVVVARETMGRTFTNFMVSAPA